jgi:predicted aldo/keto reductase-like oxidoreductase
MKPVNLGGTVTLPGTSIALNRIGYGTMQLPRPQVWGPPKDRQGVVELLREAVAYGINHIDTADFYGPGVSNQLIREALHPYLDNLVRRRTSTRRNSHEQSCGDLTTLKSCASLKALWGARRKTSEKGSG